MIKKVWAQLTTPPSAQAASRSYALLGLSNLNFQTLAPSSEQLLAFLKSPFSSCKDVIVQSKIRNKKCCKYTQLRSQQTNFRFEKSKFKPKL